MEQQTAVKASVEAEALRQRIQNAKAKRMSNAVACEKKESALAEVVSTEDLDPIAWVRKSRHLEEEKKRQARSGATESHVTERTEPGSGRASRSAEPEDLNDEDGDSPGVEDQSENAQESFKKLRVGHHVKQLRGLKPGEEIVLTLQDRRIIDEDGEIEEEEDILENEFLCAANKREKTLRESGRALGPGSGGLNGATVSLGLEEDGDDDDDTEKEKDVLSHYDAWAIESKMVRKPKGYGITKGLTLEALETVTSDAVKERQMATKAPVSLTSTSGIQRDFLTQEEMIALEKEKAETAAKKKKSSKRKRDAVAKALGSRRKVGVNMDEDELSVIGPESREKPLLGLNNRSRPGLIGLAAGELETEDDDIDDALLYAQLARSRANMAASKSKITGADGSDDSTNASSKRDGAHAAVAEVMRVQALENTAEIKLEKEEDTKDESLQLVGPTSSTAKLPMDPSVLASGIRTVGLVDMKLEDENIGAVEVSDITEFCRALETPFEKLQSLKELRSTTISARRGLQAEIGGASSEHRSKDNTQNNWRNDTAAGPEANDTAMLKNGDDISENISDDEGKGSDGEGISNEEEAVVRHILEENILDGGLCSALDYLKSKGELNDDAWRMGRRRSENAPLHISTQKGDVRLEYKDEYGRIMTPKEAFRYISWVFHGKGPGKRKREKLLRKMEIEKQTRILAANHSQLPTIRALQKQQKQGQAYLFLSGGDPKGS